MSALNELAIAKDAAKAVFPALLAGVLITASLPARAQETLRFSATDAWGMPFGEFQGEALTGGILKDLMVALAGELKMSPVFIKLPRKRVDQFVEQGAIDARCYIDPAWVSDPSLYVWTGPLFHMKELVVHRAEVPPIARLSDLKGKTVGVIFGYRGYPFDAWIESGEVVASAAQSAEHLSVMLTRNRIQYSAMNSVTYAYHLRNDPQYARVMGKQPFVFLETSVQCAFPKNGKVAGDKLLRAMESLRKRGAIEAILANYR